MARPKKAPEEKREDRLNPRLTTAERAEIEQHAAILGVSPSEFVRSRSLSYRLPLLSLYSAMLPRLPSRCCGLASISTRSPAI
jgi:hypothetical protein